MTIFTDAVGNKFLGDCIWANHSISYPTTKYLQSFHVLNASSGLTSLMASASMPSVVSGEATFNYYPVNAGVGEFLQFSFTGDTINNRYRMGANVWKNDTVGGDTPSVRVYSDGLASNWYMSNQDIVNSIFPRNILYFKNEIIEPVYDKVYITAVADGYSVGIFMTQHKLDSNTPYYSFFWYIGMLDDVNTNFNYYSLNNYTKSVGLSGWQGNIVGGHFSGVTAKNLLQTGDAQYPIVCADSQTPTSQWATDFYVFDNNATLGYPAIGRVRNLLLATGSYTIGKPVKIQGSAMPDAGFNRWLPVGIWGDKTVLMRCYSSVDI
jgi:hypothetical protein